MIRSLHQDSSQINLLEFLSQFLPQSLDLVALLDFAEKQLLFYLFRILTVHLLLLLGFQTQDVELPLKVIEFVCFREEAEEFGSLPECNVVRVIFFHLPNVVNIVE